MPETTIAIDREQREGLYELVRNHLGAIEDLWVALERAKDFAKAERLARELVEDFWLLDDIGWAEREEREAFELTMPPEDLASLLRRLHGEAGPALERTHADAAEAETAKRFGDGRDACERVLAELGPGEAPGTPLSEQEERPDSQRGGR